MSEGTTRTEDRHGVLHANGATPVPSGQVIWITGLSGAGKSTIARAVFRLWREGASNVVHLDGDEFREIMGGDLGHGREDRLRNAYRLARMCRCLSLQGVYVVCATMSLFHECQEWNRHYIPGYYEVYVRAALETLIDRDPKGLYRRALQDPTFAVVGVTLPFDEPRAPDLIVDNNARVDDMSPIAAEILRRTGLRSVSAARETELLSIAGVE